MKKVLATYFTTAILPALTLKDFLSLGPSTCCYPALPHTVLWYFLTSPTQTPRPHTHQFVCLLQATCPSPSLAFLIQSYCLSPGRAPEGRILTSRLKPSLNSCHCLISPQSPFSSSLFCRHSAQTPADIPLRATQKCVAAKFKRQTEP